ncbi:MAG: hypothetical protein GWN77_00065, partial [Gammaproteobacteria bacterium]|nr:hypothetical protein [Gammaproteobacteria bacterium]
LNGLDNWNIFADPGDLRLGLNWYATAYPTGYLSYDEVIIRDDNEAIGMGEVFRSGFETGDFSEWDSTGGSDLSVTSAAALNWSENGVSALVDDTSDSWLDKNLDWLTNSLSLRFWIDPNTITSAVSNRDVWPLRIRKGFGSYNFLQIALNYSSGQHGIGVLARNDDDTSEISSLYTITNAPHCIELVAHNSSDAVSADGQVSLYIDGSFKETITGIDWYDGWNALLDLHFGEIWADSDMSGTFYLDELVLRDDGQRIGFGRLTHIDHETGDFSEYDGEQ